ncbi:hypothetical protein [Streptomyces sp. NPDC055992]|uniref:hypothetical protein n=1 Tax=Streptomyces sp. NPDC055992 TaxID=3345673 RepID=UPI0035D6F9FD
MTNTSMVSTYSRLGAIYAEQLSSRGAAAAMLTHKWQARDLIAPHSDIDIRVILDHAPTSWWKWNEQLAAAHDQAVRLDPLHSRLLEHPPGFAFTVSELDRGRVSPAGVCTWSLVTGSATPLQRWQTRAQEMPWSSTDERFYRGILDARVKGRYQLDNDSTDNVLHDLDAYRKHCIAWHYVAPCWLAAAALTTRTRFPGKTAALSQWQPGELAEHATKFLHLATTSQPSLAPSEQLAAAHAALQALLLRTPPAQALLDEPSAYTQAWTTTAGMLRVRVARWIYYLNPPPRTATDYLIAREEKELDSARKTLTRIADITTGDDVLLAKAMAGLLPSGPTTPSALRDLLALWHRHRSVVEDFLSAHSA